MSTKQKYDTKGRRWKISSFDKQLESELERDTQPLLLEMQPSSSGPRVRHAVLCCTALPEKQPSLATLVAQQSGRTPHCLETVCCHIEAYSAADLVGEAPTRVPCFQALETPQGTQHHHLHIALIRLIPGELTTSHSYVNAPQEGRGKHHTPTCRSVR